MAQKVDLDRVTQLFDVANDDGPDKASWSIRYKDFTSKILAKYKSGMAQAEVLSLRFDLLKIVEERLDARVSKYDMALLDALRELHGESKKLFQAAVKMVGQPESLGESNATLRMDLGDSDMESLSGDEFFNSIMATPFNGVSSFVQAARKPASEKSVFARDSAFQSFAFDDEHEEDDPVDREQEDDEVKMKPQLQFDNDGRDSLMPTSFSKYTKIHTNCKARLFNLLDIERPEKVMTLGQLREIMTGCIDGKKEKDVRCKASGLQMLTLENYLFEFLELRYNSGDTNEIKEWFVALSKAINKFGVFDSDICIFGKMLRNLLAESFPDHQSVLRNTVEKMMRQEVPCSVWNEKNYNGIPLKVFEKVAYHMFNQKDAADIVKRLKDPLPKTGKRGAANLEALSREHVRYHHGIEVFMTFNMNLQDDFLHDFIMAFRKLDACKDGTLHSGEISDLINRFGTVESAKEGSSAYTLLSDARASTLRTVKRARRLTFSECVDNFTDLLSARFSVTGKKGTRYQFHDSLKASLVQAASQEKQSETPSGSDQLKSALKRINAEEKKAEERSRPSKQGVSIAQ